MADEALTFEMRPAAEAIDDAVAILSATRRHAVVSRRRCEWMYRDNPDGDATVWLARERATGVVAGFAALLPRRMRVDGEDRRAWNTADLSVRADYRRRGIASALRTRAREAVDAGVVDFLYGNPNARSEGAHRKAGYVCLGAVRRYVKILDPGAHAGRVLPASLARSLGRVAAPFLRVLDGEALGPRGAALACGWRPLEFDERFDELFETSPVARRVVGVRDARYLRWRYRDNPVDDLAVVVAERGVRLFGYAVVRHAADGLEILDLFPQTTEVAPALLRALFAEGRRQRQRAVTATLLEDGPLIPLLRELGFRRRPGSSNMFAYAPTDASWAAPVHAGSAWLALQGDRDV